MRAQAGVYFYECNPTGLAVVYKSQEHWICGLCPELWWAVPTNSTILSEMELLYTVEMFTIKLTDDTGIMNCKDCGMKMLR
jgi:hypothetical protein